MIGKTSKPSNYLFRSNLEFSIYHTQTAEVIYSLLIDGNIDGIAEITQEITEKTDEEFIQYAFMDKYGFNYAKKIQSLNASYQQRRIANIQAKLD